MRQVRKESGMSEIALLAKVLDYYEGNPPFDFYRLPADQRDNEAHDAWQEIAAEIRATLKSRQPLPNPPEEEN